MYRAPMTPALPAKRVAALAGRMFDDPAGETSMQSLAIQLRRCFIEEGIGVLVCSAARGADLVALDVAGDIGIRRVVVLPFAERRFRETSVAKAGTEWGDLYDRIIVDVRQRGDLIVNDPEDATYEKANERILDEARTMAQGNRPLAVVVWEGQPRAGSDTSAAFRQAAAADFDIREIRV